MLLIRSKNPRRCQAENPLKLLSEFPGPALYPDNHQAWPMPFDSETLMLQIFFDC
jgi:hypothetical protein